MKNYYEAIQHQREYTAPQTYEAPYAFEEKSGLQLLFETGRQHGYAATETAGMTLEPVLTAKFSIGSNVPRTGQETTR